MISIWIIISPDITDSTDSTDSYRYRYREWFVVRCSLLVVSVPDITDIHRNRELMIVHFDLARFDDMSV